MRALNGAKQSAPPLQGLRVMRAGTQAFGRCASFSLGYTAAQLRRLRRRRLERKR
jgi:hypothetical protein